MVIQRSCESPAPDGWNTTPGCRVEQRDLTSSNSPHSQTHTHTYKHTHTQTHTHTDTRVAAVYGITGGTGVEANTDYSVLHTGNTELFFILFFPVIKKEFAVIFRPI